MGSKRLWLIVEGRIHDQPFYDRVLMSHQGLDSYSIRLAETLELNGKSAGGKSFVQALHDFFETEHLLEQSNKSGPRSIAFALDRDYDHLAGKLVPSRHVLYTQTMDVESEILLFGDVRDATSSAYSLTRETVDRVLPTSQLLAIQLADRWKDWIIIGACAMCCDVPTEIPFSQRSRINVGGFGEVIEQDADKFLADVMARVGSEEDRERFAAVRLQVEALFCSGDHWMLVKGKWMTAFVWHLLSAALRDQPREHNVPSDTLAKTCLGTLDFNADWVKPYHDAIDALLAA